MRARLSLIYIIMVLLPVAALVLFGYRAVSGERLRWEQTLNEVYLSRLQGVRSSMEASQALLENRFLGYSYLVSLSPDEIRSEARDLTFCRQVFIMENDGTFLYPPDNQRSQKDEIFFSRTANFWASGSPFLQADEDGQLRRQGWIPYFEENATSYIFWVRLSGGRVLGFDIYREYILAEIMTDLAVGNITPSGKAISSIRMNDESFSYFLTDEFGRVLYKSGDYDPPSDVEPDASLSLGEPFAGWRLAAYTDPEAVMSGHPARPLLFTLSALIVALIGTAILFWRENNRELREARTKVSFVNQVSHELKTPLTNIRMYGEMLEGLLGKEERQLKYARIVVRESERLSRMIQNVLTFSRGGHRLHAQLENPEDIINEILEVTRPRLEERGFRIDRHLACCEMMNIDRDLVGQVLWNLISNVEKYAEDGHFMAVACRKDGDRLIITVADHGPGIAPSFRSSLFEPFMRGSSKLTEGVSGTGLGLSISRDLARKHGGDLVLMESGQGACFEFTIKELPS